MADIFYRTLDAGPDEQQITEANSGYSVISSGVGSTRAFDTPYKVGASAFSGRFTCDDSGGFSIAEQQYTARTESWRYVFLGTDALPIGTGGADRTGVPLWVLTGTPGARVNVCDVSVRQQGHANAGRIRIRDHTLTQRALSTATLPLGELSRIALRVRHDGNGAGFMECQLFLGNTKALTVGATPTETLTYTWTSGMPASHNADYVGVTQRVAWSAWVSHHRADDTGWPDMPAGLAAAALEGWQLGSIAMGR